MAGRGGDPALPHRVQAAAGLYEQRQPGAVEDADPRPRLGLRLPRRHRHRRVVRVGAAAQGRHQGTAADPHPARRGIRAAAALFVRSSSAMEEAATEDTATEDAGTEDAAMGDPDTGGRAGHWAARSWRAVRLVSDRTSLRTKLVATLPVLVGVAL